MQHHQFMCLASETTYHTFIAHYSSTTPYLRNDILELVENPWIHPKVFWAEYSKCSYLEDPVAKWEDASWSRKFRVHCFDGATHEDHSRSQIQWQNRANYLQFLVFKLENKKGFFFLPTLI